MLGAALDSCYCVTFVVFQQTCSLLKGPLSSEKKLRELLQRISIVLRYKILVMCPYLTLSNFAIH